MCESFGARLRRRREEQGIALVTIAEDTKIKLSTLEALERDDCSRWPTGIFRRAYVRSYAQAIGLDPVETVREFLTVHPDPAARAAEEAAAAALAKSRPGASPPTRLRTIVESAIESLSRGRRSAAPASLIDRSSAVPSARIHMGESRIEALLQTEDEAVAPPAGDPPPVHVEAPRSGVLELDLSSDPRDMRIEAPTAVPVLMPLEAAESDPVLCAPNLTDVANLCTELGCATSPGEVRPLLRTAAAVLDATGIIVWRWDEIASALRPELSHGYPDKLVARLPIVTRDAENLTANAFRSAQPCAIEGREHSNGALAVPILTQAGCEGVLAIELHRGRRQTTELHAAAAIVASLLARVIGSQAVPVTQMVASL